MVTCIDADLGGCRDTHRSTFDFCVFLRDNPRSWSSKQQYNVSRSSAEAEYRAVDNVIAEASWIHHLLHELHRHSPVETVVFYNNISVVYISGRASWGKT